jgi:hypothetical protein
MVSSFQFPLFGKNLHDSGWRLLLSVKLRHDFHRRVDVPEEFLVRWAKVVEPPLAIGGPSETVLGAFAVTCKADAALTAVVR